jgi:integrase
MEGIRERHSRACGSVGGGPCTCTPSLEASVYSRRDHRKIRRTFAGKGAASAARRWRNDARADVQKGRMRAPTPMTVREASGQWLRLAKTGIVRNRSGDAYKPSVLRGYEELLNLRLLSEVGAVRLSDLARADLQRLVGEWQAKGLSPSSIRNALMPLRALYRDLELLGVVGVPVNPTTGVRLPAVRGRRDRIASPVEAELFLAKLRRNERALWATALYAGLRRGELAALRWEDVDLAAGLIRCERSWDFTSATAVTPKSRAGRRRVPIPVVLRDELVELRMDHEREGRPHGLVFGESAERPFRPSGVVRRGQAAWRAAGLEPVGLHDARHTFASLMIAAGANAKAMATYMGHASVTTTFDLYGHLMPGNEAEAAKLLDRYLQQARDEAARAAAPEGAELPGGDPR